MAAPHLGTQQPPVIPTGAARFFFRADLWRVGPRSGGICFFFPLFSVPSVSSVVKSLPHPDRPPRSLFSLLSSLLFSLLFSSLFSSLLSSLLFSSLFSLLFSSLFSLLFSSLFSSL